MAAWAAALMCSGVSKSGSPAPKPQTSMPSAFIALALESMDRVSDGVRIVARWARSMGILDFGFGLGLAGGIGTHLPNQLSIKGFRLFSLIWTIPISRWAFSGESEAWAAFTMM